MNNFILECNNTILEVKRLLKENPEWISRYEKYAEKIDKNLDRIRTDKMLFREWAPLYLYMNINEAKGSLIFSLRYLGQDVANLKIRKDKILLSTTKFDTKNQRDFGCIIEVHDCEWRSKEAKNFRNHFSIYCKRTKKSGKGNEEHRIENLLITEFSKKKSIDKILWNIQPVKLAGISRFQMPTPLGASSIKNLKYCGPSGGGIDILTRIGTGKGVKLCVMEVKDENVIKEPPEKAILQGLAYATFIRELLRSEGGEAWWKLFGFKGDLQKRLDLFVTCVMPDTSCNDTTFANQIYEIETDRFHLNYIYFQEKDNRATDIVTSLKQCRLMSSEIITNSVI